MYFVSCAGRGIYSTWREEARSSTPPDLVPLCIDWGLAHVFHVSGGYAVHLSRQQRRRSGCFLSHRTRSCSATGLTQAGIDDNSLELQTLLDEEYAPHATPVDLRMAGARPHWIGKGTPWSIDSYNSFISFLRLGHMRAMALRQAKWDVQ
jgi:hypothetical protein